MFGEQKMKILKELSVAARIVTEKLVSEDSGAAFQVRGSIAKREFHILHAIRVLNYIFASFFFQGIQKARFFSF